MNSNSVTVLQVVEEIDLWSISLKGDTQVIATLGSREEAQDIAEELAKQLDAEIEFVVKIESQALGETL